MKSLNKPMTILQMELQSFATAYGKKVSVLHSYLITRLHLASQKVVQHSYKYSL